MPTCLSANPATQSKNTKCKKMQFKKVMNVKKFNKLKTEGDKNPTQCEI
jgi:hypothetical protein